MLTALAEPPPNESTTMDRMPGPLDALVISDLHLGSDNCQAKPLCHLLESILDGTLPTRRLIINGDVFDSIDFRRLKKNHWKVLSQIRHLSDKIDVVWIAGNHDGPAEIVSHLLGVEVVDQYILTSGSRRTLIIHGHRWDRFIEDHPILTALADAAYWVLQKVDRSHYIARLAKKRSKTFVRCANRIEHGARQLALKLHCDSVICGHTHQSLTTSPTADSPVTYYNTGCWTESPSTYLTIQNSRIELHTYAETLLHA